MEGMRVREVLTNEHPLGELVSLQIFVEHGGVLDLGKTVWARCNGVVENFRAELCQF